MAKLGASKLRASRGVSFSLTLCGWSEILVLVPVLAAGHLGLLPTLQPSCPALQQEAAGGPGAAASIVAAPRYQGCADAAAEMRPHPFGVFVNHNDRRQVRCHVLCAGAKSH
jgi:hypothetical protein